MVVKLYITDSIMAHSIINLCSVWNSRTMGINFSSTYTLTLSLGLIHTQYPNSPFGIKSALLGEPSWTSGGLPLKTYDTPGYKDAERPTGIIMDKNSHPIVRPAAQNRACLCPFWKPIISYTLQHRGMWLSFKSLEWWMGLIIKTTLLILLPVHLLTESTHLWRKADLWGKLLPKGFGGLTFKEKCPEKRSCPIKLCSIT